MLKKVVQFGIALTLTLLLFMPATSAEEIEQYMVSSDKAITMTATADPNGMKVAILKPGTRVKLIREEASWSKIEYNGRLGWVSNEALAPFEQKLLPIYASYYKILNQTEQIVYALITDFTQDGIEDLYVITDGNPSKGVYTETIYSGESIIYQKNVKHGLSILKDSTDYYLFHHSQKNSDKKYKLSELNEQASIDYLKESEGKSSYEVATNHYLMSYNIVQAGNGKIQEQTFTHEQIASKDYYGASQINDYQENIYIENYLLSSNGKTKTLSEKEYNELFALYERAKGAKIIYSDDGNSASLSDKFSFDVEKAKNELFDLAEYVLAPSEFDVLSTELALLKDKLAQSVVLEMPYEEGVARNALTMVGNVEKGMKTGLQGYEASYFKEAAVDSPLDGMHYKERMPIDNVIYDFYGATVNTEEFNALASAENRFLEKDYYQYPVSEDEESSTYIYRQLRNVSQLQSGYDILKFVDYEMPKDIIVSESNEKMLIAGKPVKEGYVIFKRLPFKEGLKWVYVDTVSDLKLMNEKQYETYEGSLFVVQRWIAEQQIPESNQAEEKSESIPLASAAPVEEEPPSKPVSWVFLGAILGLIIVSFGSAFYLYRRKLLK